MLLILLMINDINSSIQLNIFQAHSYELFNIIS